MNKKELGDAVAERLGESKAYGQRVVDDVLHVIQHAVAAGEKVQITGFGHFERKVVPAREGRNPATGDTVSIAETARPMFRAGTVFKQHVALRHKEG